MRRQAMAWTTAVLLTAVCACQPSADSRATAGPRALDRLPADPDSSGRYVLYLHGRIVQEQGPRPTHPRFGTYEHHRILEALSVPGTTVLGPIRPPGTTVDEAAATARTSLDALLDAGVPASRITVVGFSMGGAAAIRIAARQPHDDLRFVLLAACGPWLDAWLADQPAVALHGTVLSIYEASDDIGGTCDSLRSHGLGGLTELELAIGGGHGAFYRPYPEWIDPTLAWISGGRLDSRPGPTASGPG